MELYLDTANVAEVERLARIFPIAGVTTNPSIIAASKESIWEVLPRLQKAIGDEGILFAQTMSRDAQGMVEEVICILLRNDIFFLKVDHNFIHVFLHINKIKVL